MHVQFPCPAAPDRGTVVSAHMRSMTITARHITTEAEWEVLPVGTLSRVGYLEIDDDGHESDTLTMFVIRVEGDFRANAGDYMLAGGKYWSEVWVWQQGATALDTATIPEEDWPGTVPVGSSEEDAEAAIHHAITGHQDLLEEIDHMPVDEYRKIPESDLPPDSPAKVVLAALQDLGWTPAPVYPEGLQVWTITGVPAEEIRADGTMAYLSLPAGDPDFQFRSDIWLEKPTVKVNFELPYRHIG